MKNHDPSSAISRKTSGAKPQGISKVAAAPAHRSPVIVRDVGRSDLFRIFRAVAILLICVVAVIGLVLAANVINWALHGFPYDPGGEHPPQMPLGSQSPTLREPLPDWSQAPRTGDESVCAEFIAVKNAGFPAADLLGLAPAVPNGPVSQTEADRLQADFFLRQDVRIVGGGRDQTTKALVLYTKGNVSSPRIQVRTTDGVETVQRTMSNPDLIVEVRDGHIYGVAATLHTGS